MATIITTANRSTYKTEARLKLIGRDDDTVLPDATVNAFIEQVERDISKRLVGGGTTTALVLAAGGDDKENLIDAAISLLCATLVNGLRHVLPKIEKMDVMGKTYDIDWEEKVNSLRGEVDIFLGNIALYTYPTPVRCGVISPENEMWTELE